MEGGEGGVPAGSLRRVGILDEVLRKVFFCFGPLGPKIFFVIFFDIHKEYRSKIGEKTCRKRDFLLLACGGLNLNV